MPSRKSARMQFSIRTALILMSIFAFATMVYQRRTQVTRVIENAQDNGGTIKYYPDKRPWLTKYTGNFFRDVYSIDFKRKPISDEDLAEIGAIPNLQALYLPGTKIGKEGFSHIGKCKSLRRLSLWACGNLKDDCVESLMQLQNLHTIDVHNSNLTSKGVADLANIPSLRNLIFSCSYEPNRWKQTIFWYGPNEIEAIACRPEVKSKLVGGAYLDGVNDETLDFLTKIDTSRSDTLQIQNSKFTAKGIRRLNELNLTWLQFEDCPLERKDIVGMDMASTDKLTLRFGNTKLTVNDIIDQFGGNFRQMRMYESHTGFTSPSLSVVVSAPADQLEANCFSKMDLRYARCEIKNNQSFLAALEHGQPALKLFIDFEDAESAPTFWDTIRKTPSLTGLDINYFPLAQGPRFTDDHQLESLRIGPLKKEAELLMDVDFYSEIAKLQKLEKLFIQNRSQIGRECEALTKLKNLKSFTAFQVDESAANILLKMKLEQLKISLDDVSPGIFERMQNTPTTIYLNGMRVDGR